MWSGASTRSEKTSSTGSQQNAISLPSYWCGPFYTISYNKSRALGFYNVVGLLVLCSTQLLEVGLMQNQGDHETC